MGQRLRQRGQRCCVRGSGSEKSDSRWRRSDQVTTALGARARARPMSDNPPSGQIQHGRAAARHSRVRSMR